MIYWLAQRYSGMEEQSFINACNWTRKLRELGVCVISPILHTHNYHLYHMELVVRCEDCKKILTEDRYDEDYFQWNLDILEHCKDLVLLFSNDCYENRYVSKNHFGGGVSHFYMNVWIAKGAKKEYDWAKKNHVRCLKLEPFLEGNEDEI